MSFTIVVSSTGYNGYLGSRTINLAPISATYKAIVWGRYAKVNLIQTYQLEHDTSQATYKFPLDYNSALINLSITTPREVIQGIVQDKMKAEKTFDEGKRAGKQVFMTSESVSDPDINILEMGNLLKDEKIIVEFSYETELKFNKDMASFYIPFFVKGRYRGFGMDKADYEINVNVEIHAPVKKLVPTTAGMVIEMGPEITSIVYNKPTGVNSQDLEIQFQTDHGVGCYQFEAFGYTLTTAWFNPNINFGRENKKIIFVLDCSGSMWDGVRMPAAKVALKQCLNKIFEETKESGYFFNIIAYGTKYDTFSENMVYSDEENIKAAITYIDKIKDMGGTETATALKHALTLSSCAVLITDGDTSNNKGLHDICHQFLSLSVLGIGSEINRDNINKMALHGHGKAIYCSNSNTIINAAEELMRVSSIPSLSEVVTNLSKAVDVPEEMPTYSMLGGDTVPPVQKKINLFTKNPLIPHEFYVFYGISNHKKALQTELTFTTHTTDGIFQETLPVVQLPDALSANELAPIIVKRILQHNPGLEKEVVLPLALAFNLVTPYTSIVAVGEHNVQIPVQEEVVHAERASLRLSKSARTIITSDSNISLNQAGIPAFDAIAASGIEIEDDEDEVLHGSVFDSLEKSRHDSYRAMPKTVGELCAADKSSRKEKIKEDMRKKMAKEGLVYLQQHDKEDDFTYVIWNDPTGENLNKQPPELIKTMVGLMRHFDLNTYLFRPSVLSEIGFSSKTVDHMEDSEEKNRIVTMLVIMYFRLKSEASEHTQADIEYLVDLLMQKPSNAEFEIFKQLSSTDIRKLLTDDHKVVFA